MGACARLAAHSTAESTEGCLSRHLTVLRHRTGEFHCVFFCKCQRQRHRHTRIKASTRQETQTETPPSCPPSTPLATRSVWLGFVVIKNFCYVSCCGVRILSDGVSSFSSFQSIWRRSASAVRRKRRLSSVCN